MKLSEAGVMMGVLRKEAGLSMFPLLVRAQLAKGNVFRKTRWVGETGVESAFAKRLSISAALYHELLKKFDGEKAFTVMRRILVPIGTAEQLANLDTWGVSPKSGMEKLLAFYDAMGKGGVGRFVKRTIMEKNERALHFEVRNCFFKRFYEETGTPELTRLFCEVDIEFFSRGFPDFAFSRGDSLENTVAYGKEHCDFIFRLK